MDHRRLKPLTAFSGALAMTALQPPARAQQVPDDTQRDVDEMARQTGISAEEAARRATIEDKFNKYLQDLATSKNFVTAVIQSTPKIFSLRVLVTNAGRSMVQASRMMRDPDTRQIISIETAPYTLDQLNSFGEKIFAALDKGEEAATKIDPLTGKLIVEAKNVQHVIEVVSRLGLGAAVTVEHRDNFSRPVDLLEGFPHARVQG